MYCQKCDTHVCDRCHKIDHPDHYHYLVLDKPLTPQERELERLKQEAMAAINKKKELDGAEKKM
jgi:hypothetical protein